MLKEINLQEKNQEVYNLLKDTEIYSYEVKDKTVGTGTSAKTTKRAFLGENVAGDFSITKKE